MSSIDWGDDDLKLLFQHLSAVVDTNKVMLVGARCRDILHRRYSAVPPQRKTEDIDIAIAINSADEFKRLRDRFAAPRSPWQRLSIAGMSIDVVPFGGVEAPPGFFMSADGHKLHVSGFREVFAASELYQLSGIDGIDTGVAFRLPTPAGLAALKLHAWLDRYPEGQYKDAIDLALIIAWYDNDDLSLWDTYFALECSHVEFDGDPDLMAAYVLGDQISALLGLDAATYLLDRLRSDLANSPNHELLATKLVAGQGWDRSLSVRLLQIEALIAGMAGHFQRL